MGVDHGIKVNYYSAMKCDTENFKLPTGIAKSLTLCSNQPFQDFPCFTFAQFCLLLRLVQIEEMLLELVDLHWYDWHFFVILAGFINGFMLILEIMLKKAYD